MSATSDVVVPANVGITFGSGEKIEGDNTDLTVTSGAKINLSATSDVHIPNDVGIVFGGASEKIEGDGTDLTISGAKINLAAVSDVHLANNIGIVFGDAGEKIEGDGTDLTINSSNDLNLTATTDINIPANVGLTFGDDGEKIEGNGTALTIASSQRLFLDAADDVFIDAADDIFLDAGDDIILDAAGVTQFKTGGTPILQASYPDGDGNVYLYHLVADGHLIFGGIDGSSIVNALNIDMAAAGAAAFNSSITSGGAAVKVAGKETIWIPASAMQPTESNGCSDLTTVETTSGRPDMVVLDFDDGADEHAQFSVAFPKSYNLGTVTFKAYWTTTATDTDGCTWGLQGVAMNDNETIDVAYGTAVVVDDAAQGAAEELYITAESGAITIAGTMADEDLCFFRVFRDVSDSNDTMAEDARLIGIKLFFTTDAANDA